jgi:hypothetical protein
MARVTIKQLRETVAELTTLTGMEHTVHSYGAPFWTLYYTDKFGQKVEITCRKASDLNEFMDAYRRGFACCQSVNNGPPMPHPPRRVSGNVEKGKRLFKGTFMVAVDDNESNSPVTEEGLRKYMEEALTVELDTEEWGSVGVSGVTIFHDTLTEMPKHETGLYIGQDPK